MKALVWGVIGICILLIGVLGVVSADNSTTTNTTCPACTDCGISAPNCVPQCFGKICGSDGCGGSCGQCGTGETCNSDGVCYDNGYIGPYVLKYNEEKNIVFRGVNYDIKFIYENGIYGEFNINGVNTNDISSDSGRYNLGNNIEFILNNIGGGPNELDSYASISIASKDNPYSNVTCPAGYECGISAPNTNPTNIGGDINYDYLHIYPTGINYIILDGQDDFIAADVEVRQNFSSSLQNTKLTLSIIGLDLSETQTIDTIQPNYGTIPKNQFHIDIPRNTPSGRYQIRFDIVYTINGQEYTKSTTIEKDIAKVEDLKCEKSDGVDFYDKGTLTLTFPSGLKVYMFDGCSDKNPNILYEYVCNNTNGMINYNPAGFYIAYNCPFGCKDDACLKISPDNNSQQPVDINQRIEDITNDTIKQQVKQNIDYSAICQGCALDTKCYPFGFRKGKTYCDDNSSNFINQQIPNSICNNNFECDSNLCVNNSCVSGSLWQKVMDWFSHLFGGK